MHRFLLTLAIALITTFPSLAQAPVDRATVFFRSGTAELDASALMQLNATFLGNKRFQKVKLIGHTDVQGNDHSNKTLSEERTRAVFTWVQAHNTMPQTRIEMEWFGETRPATPGTDSLSHARNRRVDIELMEADGWMPVAALFKSKAITPERFCIRVDRDTAIVARQGTIIYYRANSVRLPEGESCSCVTVEVKEALQKKDIILENLSSTAGGWPLISQSMLYVSFTCNNRALPLLKDFLVLAPSEKDMTGAKVFNGQWLDPHTIDWQADDSNTIEEVNARKIADCMGGESLRDRVIPGDEGCANCRLVFCGMGKWAASLFSSSRKDEAAAYFSCRRDAIAQRRARRKSGQPNKLPDEYAKSRRPTSLADSLELDECGRILKIFKTNRDQLRRDVLQKSLEQAQRNGNPVTAASLDELQYSVFATSQTGWSNIDWMMKVDAADLEQLDIMVEPSAFSDCKIIFKKQRTILPGIRKHNDRFIFPMLPRGHEAWILTVHTKTAEGKILYELREIITGKATYTPVLKEVSVQEFVAVLEVVNGGKE